MEVDEVLVWAVGEIIALVLGSRKLGDSGWRVWGKGRSLVELCVVGGICEIVV